MSEAETEAPQQCDLAAQLLRRRMGELTSLIDEPAGLAEKLFSKEVISYATYQAAIDHEKNGNDRSRDLLSRIYKLTSLDSDNLGVFLTELHQLPARGNLPRVRTEMKTEYGTDQQV